MASHHAAKDYKTFPSIKDHEEEVDIVRSEEDEMKFVAEVQSTAEVFMNRLKSCQIRNRPIATDSSIQSLFIKVTEMHSQLLSLIEKYESRRNHFETLQDKITRITDARAALDALREEHADNVLVERQSMLNSKLESMRKRKAQSLRYHADLASIRINQNLEHSSVLTEPQDANDVSNNLSSKVEQVQAITDNNTRTNPIDDDEPLIKFD